MINIIKKNSENNKNNNKNNNKINIILHDCQQRLLGISCCRYYCLAIIFLTLLAYNAFSIICQCFSIFITDLHTKGLRVVVYYLGSCDAFGFIVVVIFRHISQLQSLMKDFFSVLSICFQQCIMTFHYQNRVQRILKIFT